MISELQQSLEQIAQQSQANAYYLCILLAILWGIYIINLILGGRLLYFGIIPRTFIGLRGIFFSPFLHANFNHLFFNNIPLVVLANFLLIRGSDYFINASIYIMLLSGFLTWLIGKRGLHIGASGVITGYWAVLACDFFTQSNLTSIILGLLSIYYFAAIFFGAFPSSKKGVSWEGHLSGLLAGVSYALLYKDYGLLSIM